MHSKKTILFMSSNGTGVGHLTRLMAMARRASRDTQPIFFTLSQAVKVVEESGFYAEYFPSNDFLNIKETQYWHMALEQRLNEVNELYKPEVVVFDGVHPYRGLINFLQKHPGIKGVWSRRAMWKKSSPITSDDLFRLSSNFNLVIEPGEISEKNDNGVTVSHREHVTLVDPITYLDKSELLSKSEAKKQLGLDPDKTACLLQLGAGNINDTSSIFNQIMEVYGDINNLQICIPNNTIANQTRDAGFSNVANISYYPLSRCFNAFDFAIGAAGYNTFHELINFGLPALIIPNTHAKTDNALNRISLPRSQKAILVAEEGEPDDIQEKAKLLLDKTVRLDLRRSLEKLHKPNGAKAAMEAVENLLNRGPL